MIWKNIKAKPCDLIPYEKNPRKITDEKRADLISSLEKFSLVDVVILNSDFTIISGHKRVEALIEMGLGEKKIDCRISDRKLTEAELQEYNLLANTHVGEFDIELLDKHFSDFDLSKFNLDVGKFLKDTETDFENIEMEDSANSAKESEFIESEKPQLEKDTSIAGRKTHTCPNCNCEFDD